MTQVVVEAQGEGKCEYCGGIGRLFFLGVMTYCNSSWELYSEEHQQIISKTRLGIIEDLGFTPFDSCCIQCAHALQEILYRQFKHDSCQLDII